MLRFEIRAASPEGNTACGCELSWRRYALSASIQDRVVWGAVDRGPESGDLQRLRGGCSTRGGCAGRHGRSAQNRVVPEHDLDIDHEALDHLRDAGLVDVVDLGDDERGLTLSAGALRRRVHSVVVWEPRLEATGATSGGSVRDALTRIETAADQELLQTLYAPGGEAQPGLVEGAG
jgi:hypothetical protein